MKPHEGGSTLSLKKTVELKQQYAKTQQARFTELRANAIANRDSAQHNSRRFFETRHRTQEFEIGDQITMKNPDKRMSKLEDRFIGPLEVINRKKDVYKVKRLSDNRLLTRHTSSLSRFHAPEISLLNIIFTIITILSMTSKLMASVSLREIDTQVWREADRIVVETVSRYKVYWGQIDICQSILNSELGIAYRENPQEWDTRILHPEDTLNQYSSNLMRIVDITDIKSMKLAYDGCTKIWNEEWLSRIQQLSTKSSRSFTVAAAAGIGGAVIYGVGSAVYSYVKSWFVSDENSVEEDIKKLQKNDAVFKEITDSLLTITENLNDRLRNLTQTLDKQTENIASMAIQTMRITLDMQKALASMDKIIGMAGDGFVATKQLASLLNITNLKEVDHRDTKFLSATYDATSRIVVLEFIALQKSKSTSVYVVDAFDHWANLSGRPSLMHYRGTPYLIYNKTSNCAAGVMELHSRLVTTECKTPNHIDSAIENWVSTGIVDKFDDIYNQTQIKLSTEWSYIYCFRDSITIINDTRICPSHPFKIPIDIPFNVSTYHHTVSNIEIRAVNELLVLDQVGLSNFFSESRIKESLQLVNNSLELHRLHAKLQNSIQLDTGIIKKGISTFTILILCIIAYVTHRNRERLRKFFTSKKQNNGAPIKLNALPFYTERTVSQTYPTLPGTSQPSNVEPAIKPNRFI